MSTNQSSFGREIKKVGVNSSTEGGLAKLKAARAGQKRTD
jgi:hypothetical protein